MNFQNYSKNMIIDSADFININFKFLFKKIDEFYNIIFLVIKL